MKSDVDNRDSYAKKYYREKIDEYNSLASMSRWTGHFNDAKREDQLHEWIHGTCQGYPKVDRTDERTQ